MSTTIQTDHEERPESSAQSLLIWMGVAMLAVTVVIIAGITLMSATAGMLVAYGVLIVAAVVVFGYIMKFIGPEEH